MTPERQALVAHARRSIARGSRSFALASRLFDRATRERVWLLYAWCRTCDDLADAQDHGGAPLAGGAPPLIGERLATIRRLTGAALAGEETGEPAFDALRLLAREVGLSGAMADDVIAGFALDAQGWRPASEADMLRYCYHVAGAVGVMMAAVMGVSPADDDLLDRASDLGIAFQLANIARDLAEDHGAGRCYLPADWLVEHGLSAEALMEPRHRPQVAGLVRRLCGLAAVYAASARAGARHLPFRQRWAVLAAANVYGGIAREAERRGAAVLDARIVTSRAAKLAGVARALVQAILPARPVPSPRLSRRQLASAAASGG